MKYTPSDIFYTIGGVAILASTLIIWQIVSITNTLPPTVFPPASVVLVSLYQLLTAKSIYVQLIASLIRLFEGFFLAALIGIGVGVPMGLNRTAEKTGDPLVQFLRPMPSAVLIPLAIFYFGLGNAMIVSIVTYACIWPILINTIDGIKSIDTIILDTSTGFQVKGFSKIRKVIIPAASPFIFSGLRVSLGVAWIVEITAEMLSTAATTGIGAAIFSYFNIPSLPPVYATIIFVALLAYALNRLFLIFQSKIIPWHEQSKRRTS
ncbi:MAG: ABC transporter permease [Nitrososphaerota archaeon]|nr:ABC transporter permease [Nitrososphaerota archaeon]